MLVHLDGFDSYTNVTDFGTEYVMYSSANVAVNTSAGRFGASGLVFNNASSSGIGRSIASTTQIWIGYAANVTTFSTSNCALFHVYGAAGAEFTVTYYNGILKVVRGTGTGTVVGTYPVTISTGVWHWFEFYYTYGASAGVCEVWMDGAQLCAFSGNTTNAGSGSITAVAIGAGTVSGSGLSGFIGTVDDLYILDATTGANTTRLGDCRIGTLLPTSNASPNQGTPSTGSAYTCVDEAQWNTTDYVTFTPYSAEKIEAYGMSSLPSTPTTVYGVRVLAIGDKSDAGSAGFYPYIASSGSSALGTGQPLLTSWARNYSIFETDPHTSAAWAGAAVNAMSCGVQTV